MNEPPRRPLVFLLRSTSGEPDPYVEAFASADYRARCIPVLAFSFPNQEVLRERLSHPGRYGGLVLTSPRAVAALEDALRWLPNQSAAWKAKPAYVVGPRTDEEVEALGFEPEGAEAGNAEALADFIDGAYADEAPLLFLCGNRRRDVLPQRLAEEGVPFEEQVVYETRVRTDLDFSGDPFPDWIVFFSPSGIEAAQKAKGLDWKKVHVGAIGPTTAAALREAGFTPEAVAEAPAPEALVAAIAEAEKM